MKLRHVMPAACMIVLLGACAAFAITLRDETFATRDIGTVVFSHNRHIRLKGIGNDCKSCHNAIFPMKGAVRHTMADMAAGASCGACHNGRKAFALGACTRCHPVKDVTFRVRETGPVTFSHRAHTRNTPCTACHARLYAAGPARQVGMARMARGKSCGACHNGRKAFALNACTRCHPVREVTMAVKETGPVRFSHKSHLTVVTCGDCHLRLFNVGATKTVGMAQMARGKSCGACHDGATAFGVSACTRCHPVREVEYEEASAGNVLFSHTFHLGMYTCKECHPALYLPARGKRGVTMAEMRRGTSCGSCHDGKTAFAARGECDRCHTLMAHPGSGAKKVSTSTTASPGA